MALFPDRQLTPPLDEMVDEIVQGRDLEDDALTDPVAVDGATVYRNDDGSVTVDYGGEAAARPIIEGEFYDNLAEDEKLFSEDDLRTLAVDLIDRIGEDEKSRDSWKKRLLKGIKLMGVLDEDGAGPFKGASRVIHPVLIEAGVQSQARSFAELCPPTGPVKPKVYGDPDAAIRARADRAAGYMNYLYTDVMPEAFDEMDALLFRLPFEGSCFKKSYHDRTLGRLTQVMIPGINLIVPFNATSLETAPRYTEVIKKYANDVKRAQQSGEYRMVTLQPPKEEESDEIEETLENIEGRARAGIASSEDDRYKIYECHVDCHFPQLTEDHLTDEDGKPLDIALPYIVTIETESQTVLAIRRNWKEADAKKVKRVWYTHYKYLPGFGFYGFGLFHCIGGIAQATTGALRAILDSAAFSILQGGFKSRDAKVREGDTIIRPGEWKETDMTTEELSKSFYRLPYTEPSQVLFQLLGFLVQAAQRFASTTEAMVGDADNKGPVGTTVALIEQGSKVFSTIHRRLHRAQGREFKLVAEIIYDTLRPDEEYPYRVENGERHVIREDFDGRVDLVPVSDPNIFSATQRIALAQAVYQMAIAPGSTIDRRVSELRMLQALRVPDYEELAPDPTAMPRMNAIEENMALLNGKPIRTYPDQDHAAHMAVHDTWFDGLPPQGQKMLMGQHIGHRAEHMAMQYRLEMEATIGKALPPPPDFRETPAMMRRHGEQPPPEVERRIDTASAQAAQIYAQKHPPQKSPEQVEAERKAAHEAVQDEVARAEAETDRSYKAGLLAAEKEKLDIERGKAGTDGKVAEIEAGIEARARADAIRMDAEAKSREIREKTDSEVLVLQEKARIENDPATMKARLDNEAEIARYRADRDYEARIEVAKIQAAAKPKPTGGKGQSGGGKQKTA